MANGGVIKQVKIKDTDTTLNIGSTSAEYIGYSANGVSNVKAALDNLFTNQGSGGGSSSGNAENITYRNNQTVKDALDSLLGHVYDEMNDSNNIKVWRPFSNKYVVINGSGGKTGAGLNENGTWNVAAMTSGSDAAKVTQIMIPCNEGDKFKIKTIGKGSPRAYAFLGAWDSTTSTYNIIEAVIGTDDVITERTVTAPTGTQFLLVSHNDPNNIYTVPSLSSFYVERLGKIDLLENQIAAKTEPEENTGE